MDEELVYGFKRITLENILEPDMVNNYFCGISETGEILPATIEERAIRIIEPHLKETVPIEIKRLFEVARGTVVYGWFFYPLYTLGCEQLYRVIEAAVKAKCNKLNIDIGKSRRLHDALKKLESKAILNYDNVWQNIRKLRNSTSHPQYQTIIPPGMAISQISIATELINSLF